MVNVIILSNGKTPALQKMTQDCVDSCRDAEDGKIHCAVIEQVDIEYRNCNTYFNDIFLPFNYNQSLNWGVELTENILRNKPSYVAFCNNDLVFHKHWATNIIAEMEANDLLSASPLCPINNVGIYKPHDSVQLGYRLRHEINGWCIVVNRKIFDIIGKLDESFGFWFADNMYSEQLKDNNIRHALISASQVTHLGSQTLNTLEDAEKAGLTTDEIDRFIAAKPHNETAIHFAKYR